MKWQLIETAPKDGTRFLAYQPVFGISIVCRQDPGGGHYECWVIDNPCRPACQPTHWQPLPATPVTKGVRHGHE
jgi:hypothetical protein